MAISPRLLAVARGWRPRLRRLFAFAHRTLFPAFFRDELSQKKCPDGKTVRAFFGDLAAIRTRDPQLRRLLLYPT
ncbi:MAG: hypothetical protein J5716_05235, partial [Alphaproteobacteria bacterium]|nr:hypothetical protein [Alphaproteobacteria bacterium]